MAAPIEKLSAMRIGCDNAVWAPVVKDDGVTLEYGEVVALPGLMALSINPNTTSETAFYDDGPAESATTLGAVEVSLTKSALGTKESATLLGHAMDSNGMVIYGANDTAPEGALGFRTLKSDGTYKYCWLLKGVFTDPEESNETKGDSINFQSDEITGNFSKVNKKFTVTDTITGNTKEVQPWRNVLDAGAEGANADLIAAWFTDVITPAWTNPSLPTRSK